jgi:hypothetical protein
VTFNPVNVYKASGLGEALSFLVAMPVTFAGS